MFVGQNFRHLKILTDEFLTDKVATPLNFKLRPMSLFKHTIHINTIMTD